MVVEAAQCLTVGNSTVVLWLEGRELRNLFVAFVACVGSSLMFGRRSLEGGVVTDASWGRLRCFLVIAASAVW